MDISKATDLELMRELMARIENNPSPDVYNVTGYETKHSDSIDIQFYIDDGNDSFCIPTFSFNKEGALYYINNDLNCDFDERLDEYFDNHQGEYELLDLAKRALSAYGV